MASRKRSDELIIGALARGLRQREAAVEAGVSERTLRRRLADPHFFMRVAQEQKARAREASSGIVALLPDAVGTLGDVLRNGKPETQLRAAQVIIDTATRYSKDAELEAKTTILFPSNLF